MHVGLFVIYLANYLVFSDSIIIAAHENKVGFLPKHCQCSVWIIILLFVVIYVHTRNYVFHLCCGQLTHCTSSLFVVQLLSFTDDGLNFLHCSLSSATRCHSLFSCTFSQAPSRWLFWDLRPILYSRSIS